MLASLGSHVNENEKKIVKKIRKCVDFFQQIPRTSEPMAQGNQETKFERNPCDRFRDNR